MAVEAIFPLPAMSVTAFAWIVVITVPLTVMPLTATLNVVPSIMPISVTLAVVAPAVPESVTLLPVKPDTDSMNVAVKLMGAADVGSACPLA